MTIQEALNNLDQVCAEYKGTRQDHVVLQESMQVLAAATVPPKKKIEPTEKEPEEVKKVDKKKK